VNEDSGIETNRAMKRKRERERERERRRRRGREGEGGREKGEIESEGVQRESGCEGGKTVEGIGGAKLLGGGLIKPS